MPQGKFQKIPCSICEKMIDPRGIGGHMRLHKSADGKKILGEAYVDPRVINAVERANATGDTAWDVVMVPISREVILKLVNDWLQAGAAGDRGAKSKPKA